MLYIYRLYHYGRCIYTSVNEIHIETNINHQLRPRYYSAPARRCAPAPRQHHMRSWRFRAWNPSKCNPWLPTKNQPNDQRIVESHSNFWVSVSVWWDGFRSCKYSVVGWGRMLISWRKTSIFTWINYSRRNFDTASTKLGEWQINLKQTTQWKFNQI